MSTSHIRPKVTERSRHPQNGEYLWTTGILYPTGVEELWITAH
jgi:hypothetical protein